MIETLTTPVVPYPCLECTLVEGGQVRWSDGFMELRESSDVELAGMGLAIIGNVCRQLAEGVVSPMADATLVLRLAPGVERDVPWPGMPDDRSVPLDLTQMPFEAAMFLGPQEGLYKQRVDRLSLMHRIETAWVPYLRQQLEAYA